MAPKAKTRKALEAAPSTAPSKTLSSTRSTRSKAPEPPASEPPARARGRRERSASEEDTSLQPAKRGRQQQKQRRQPRKNANTTTPAAATKTEASDEDQETQDTIRIEVHETDKSNASLDEAPEDEQELPGSQSPTLSGTTARTSYGTRDGLSQQKMIDFLPDLWSSARKLVHLLAPSIAGPEEVKQLANDLKNKTSLEYRNRHRHSEMLNEAMEYFTYHGFVDVSAAQTDIINIPGVKNTKELTDDSLRADEIFYMANLAWLVDSELFINDSIDLGTWEHLDRQFPEPFLSGFGDGIDETADEAAVFALAMSLRVQYFKSVVAEHSKRPNFVALDALRQTFFESKENGSGLKGWNLRQLHPENIEDGWKDIAMQQIEKLEKIITETEGARPKQLMKGLDESFPEMRFKQEVMTWVSARSHELEEKFAERQQRDIEGLQKALDTHMRNNSGRSPWRTRNSQAIQESSLQSSAVLESPTSRPSNVASPGKRRTKSSRLSSTARQAGVAVGEPELNSQPAAARVVPVSPKRIIKTKSKSATKGSLPPINGQKSFLEPQKNATKVKWNATQAPNADDSDYAPPVGDDDYDQDNDSLSQDSGFQEDLREDHRHKRRPAKRGRSSTEVTITNEASLPKRTKPTVRPVPTASREEHHEEHRDGNVPSHSQLLRETRPVYLPTVPKSRGPRRFWSEEEDDALIKGLHEFVNQYDKFAQIQKKYSADEGKGVLEGRSNVDLKDRSRNLKMQYLIRGMEVPVGLKYIPLKRADLQKLEDRGLRFEYEQ